MSINNNNEEFDPMVWANLAENGNESEIKARGVSNPTKNYGLDNTSIEAQVDDVVKEIVRRGMDITSGYDAWLKLGFALADGLGEGGRGYYHDLSRMNDDYNHTECDKQFDACLHSGGHGVTIKTLFYMASEAGVDLSKLSKDHLCDGVSSIQKDEVCATCAIVPHGTKNTNYEIKGSIEGCDDFVPGGTMAQVAQTCRTFTDKIPREDWPSFCFDILDSQPDAVGRDKMILGSLNLVSGVLPKSYYTIYDHKRVYAPLFNIIYGYYATRKGDLEACRQLVAFIKAEMRSTYEAKRMEYEKAYTDWESAPKATRGKAPTEPVFRTLSVPANSSASAVYRSLDANEGWGVMFDTEADTLTNILSKSEYGDYSDLLRKIFHHEMVSMMRVSDHINIEILEGCLSVLLTCTPSQLPLLLSSSNVANGLASRFLFYALPKSKVVFRDVFEGGDNPIDDVYKNLGHKLIALYHALEARKSRPIQFVLSKAQQQEFVSTFDSILREQFQMMGDGIQGFIYRIALCCCRYAMVLSALRRLSERFGEALFDDDEQVLLCDERDFRIALEIVNCLVCHTARVYSVIGGHDEDPFAKLVAQPPAELKKFFEALPEDVEFKASDAMTIAKTKSISRRTANRYLGDLVSKYEVLDRIRQGVYRKLKQ